MATTAQVKKFIDLLAPLAIEECRKRGYGNAQAWTCVAQSCLETGYGTSALMTKANAFFGIKASTGWKGKVFSSATKECYDGKTYTNITAAFRAYDNVKDSVRDYFDFIEGNRYKSSLKATTVKDCITAIKNGGYATDPSYVGKIVSIYENNKSQIEKYNLGQTMTKTEEKQMSVFSSLITSKVDFGTNKSNPRTKPIVKITPHHTAGTASATATAKSHRDTSRQASANYYISDDSIVGGVSEDRRAWTSGGKKVDNGMMGRDNDFVAITFEVTNSKIGGDWPISDKSYRSLVRLCADICKRYNIVPHYTGTSKGTITTHDMYSATACVPTDSEVLTRDGWVMLKDIQIGDEIACADIDNLRISFEEVYDKVPTKQQDTYTNNDLTATKDHRMVYWTQSNQTPRIDFFNNILAKAETNQLYIPLAGQAQFEGLPISNEMIQFYVAVQADGHYMYEKKQDGTPSYYGLEFHFAKERKVDRIKEILDSLNIAYTETKQSNGTVKIRAYNPEGFNIVSEMCEKYLQDKDFTWDWLRMSPEQAAFFLEEIMLWDGCIAGKKYTSKKKINLDIVNAIAAINKVGSRIIGDSVFFRDTAYMNIVHETKRHPKRNGAQITEVSCVSVKTGTFLMRQHGKTFIVGNCPGPYLKGLIASGKFEKDILAEMKGSPAPAAPAPSKPESPAVLVAEKGEIAYRVQLGAFSTKVAAHAFMNDFKEKGYTARILQEGRYYKVQHPEQGFKNKSDADLSRGALLKMGYKGAFVVPGRN